MKKIIERNNQYYEKIEELKKSLLKLEPEGGWLQAISRSYQDCKDYGFPVRSV
jgi:hypothetical protein